MPTLIKDRPPSELLQLDWKAYFAAFKQLHGDPVLHDNLQLFPDGWTYSASDYKGPEWPPPADPEQLRLLQLAYWSIRRDIVAAHVEQLQRLQEHCRVQQTLRSAALQHRVRVRADDGRLVTRSEAVDADGIRAELADAEADVAECEKQIAELETKRPEVI